MSESRCTCDTVHPLDVIAVGNPEPLSSNLNESTIETLEIGYRKGSGYGIVELNKQEKTARISLYRVGRKEEQFDGFPQTIKLGGM